MTKTLIRATIAFGLLSASISPAVAAAPTTTRADSYFEIWCTTADGEVYLAKRVDAHAVQPQKDPGGKDTATEQFNENNPYGEHCVAIGPIAP